jgi:fructose-bisphosphate aldolase, class I
MPVSINPLVSTVQAMLTPGKGLLAADESFPTIGKRFKALGIPDSEENRRAYREMLFTAPGLGEFVSGVILFDETVHQSTSQGTSMPATLSARAIIPGIKVDAGTEDMPGFAHEKITQGLDGLRERLGAYVRLGARFTKWRAVITIGPGIPTAACIEANSRSLALFAALSQESGLVPIVEPEVLMDGDHTLRRCEEVTSSTLKAVFDALLEHRVVLEHMVLKTGMVLSGTDCPDQAGVAQVAEATLRCLRRSVPAAVPGIVFLSGGQGEKDATERLNAICREGGNPWSLTFSYGRALQDSAMKTWNGSAQNVAAAQRALLLRARCNGLAVQGKYSNSSESPAPAGGA